MTGTSMVYRIESIGYLGSGSPVVRIEAIVDINLGALRILYFRELSDLDNPCATSRKDRSSNRSSVNRSPPD